ncbi:MAG: methionyl-tRNA formyltransferase [Acidimicrobiaceae bacterium]|nr:methionyl-tRNA formyltransferase [Acidimicrobiaceae bacterium]
MTFDKKTASRIHRVVYFGSPQISVKPLQALYSAGYEVTLVVSRPSKRRTRRGRPIPTPVALAARDLKLSVAVDVRDSAVFEAVASADLGVVVAYGALIPEELLQRLLVVNLHFSLLPRWRGAAPVQRAILAGDTETGVCLMGVSADLDRGDVYEQISTPVNPQESAVELQERLCEMGIAMLLESLDKGLGEAVPQSGVATYASKIESSQLRIRWDDPAEHIHRLVRVGGAWTTFQGRRLKILEARWRAAKTGNVGSVSTVSVNSVESASIGEVDTNGHSSSSEGGFVVSANADSVTVSTGFGELDLLVVQTSGRKPVTAGAWRNGARIKIGAHFE